MTKRLRDLPVGALIKDKGSSYYGKDIIWLKLEDNHYGMGETTLLSKYIISAKSFDAKEPKNPANYIKYFGNSSYIYSNIRQWLNSNELNWYKPQHEYDAPPTKNVVTGNPYANEKGFMTNLTNEFIMSLITTNLRVARNDLWNNFVNFSDKIFLLSTSELGNVNEENSPNEGKPFEYFKHNNSATTATQECVDNSDYDISGYAKSTGMEWWLRTPARTRQTAGIMHDCSVYCGEYSYGEPMKNRIVPYSCFVSYGGIRPALNIRNDVQVSDTPDADGAYVLQWNQAPTISGEDTDLGEKNRPFDISYEVKDADTTDNVTITEYLNNSVIRTISNANNTNQTLKITQELLNSCPLGQRNTVKIYAEDSKGAGTYRNYWFTRTNTPPYFVESNTDLGTISEAPTVQFTPRDDDGDNNLNVKVKLNQKVVKTYSRVASGTQLSYTMDWKDFMQLDHSIQHNLWVELEDSSGAISILKHTFQRDTKKIEIEVNTDVLKNKIKLVVFNANVELGEGATLEQWACIDYEGAKTWEKIVNGTPYTFKTSQGSNAKLGYRCVLKKGSTKSVVKSIGGSFI